MLRKNLSLIFILRKNNIRAYFPCAPTRLCIIHSGQNNRRQFPEYFWPILFSKSQVSSLSTSGGCIKVPERLRQGVSLKQRTLRSINSRHLLAELYLETLDKLVITNYKMLLYIILLQAKCTNITNLSCRPIINITRYRRSHRQLCDRGCGHEKIISPQSINPFNLSSQARKPSRSARP